MKKHRLVVAGLLAAGCALVSAPIAGAAPSVLVVGSAPGCAGAYPTISAAVAAAAPGDTIQVCAGTYNESVAVPFPLTFLGAQAGKKGSRHAVPAKESTVNDLNGDFVISSAASGTTISGFTIQGAGSDAVTADGINSFTGASGITVEDNIIQNNEVGINLANPNSSLPATITDNAFVDNSNGTTGDGGTGIFISNGPANATTISSNTFTGHRQAAINFAGETGNDSAGLVVENNTSVDDSTFVVATNSQNALIFKNKITVDGALPANGTAILDFGGNTSLRITHNTLKGGAAVGTSGIKLADFAGSASVGTTVSANKISGRYWAIRVTTSASPYTTAFISANKISGSTEDGILVETGSTNVLTKNKVSTSAVSDCVDETTGSGTAGTANVWTANKGLSANSSPAGIC